MAHKDALVCIDPKERGITLQPLQLLDIAASRDHTHLVERPLSQQHHGKPHTLFLEGAIACGYQRRYATCHAFAALVELGRRYDQVLDGKTHRVVEAFHNLLRFGAHAHQHARTRLNKAHDRPPFSCGLNFVGWHNAIEDDQDPALSAYALAHFPRAPHDFSTSLFVCGLVHLIAIHLYLRLFCFTLCQKRKKGLAHTWFRYDGNQTLDSKRIESWQCSCIRPIVDIITQPIVR